MPRREAGTLIIAEASLVSEERLGEFAGLEGARWNLMLKGARPLQAHTKREECSVFIILHRNYDVETYTAPSRQIVVPQTMFTCVYPVLIPASPYH